MSEPKILIVDLGSQISEVIARVAGEEGYRTALLDPHKAKVWLRTNATEAIILSGGDNSVYAPGALQPPKEIFEAKTFDGGQTPILGICYGHHWLAQHFGGTVAKGLPEYGRSAMTIAVPSPLFRDFSQNEVHDTWMSHGDTVMKVPPHWFIESARSSTTGGTAAIESVDGRIYGVQFHPESPEMPRGKEILMNFIRGICRCKPDWEPTNLIASIESEL